MARRRPKVVVPIVIDASLTASWHFEDERSEPAEAILESLEHDSAYAPLIWWFEIRNVITLGERRKRATKEQTADFLAFLSQLPIGLDSLPDEGRAGVSAAMIVHGEPGIGKVDAARVPRCSGRGVHRSPGSST